MNGAKLPDRPSILGGGHARLPLSLPGHSSVFENENRSSRLLMTRKHCDYGHCRVARMKRAVDTPLRG